MELMFDEQDNHAALMTKGGGLEKTLRKLYKAVLAAFKSKSKQSSSFRINILITIGFTLISTVQGVSLVLTRQESIPEYSNLSQVFAVINYVRFDTVAVEMGMAQPFFYVVTVFIYLPLFILVANMFLVYKWKQSPHWLAVKVMHTVSDILDQIFFFPVTVLMMTYIKYTYLSSSTTMFEYGESPDLLQSPALAAISIVSIPVLISLIYLNSYFFYDCLYVKRRKLVYSMRDSFVHRVDLVVRVAIVLCYSFVSTFNRVWYRIAIMLICFAMFLLDKFRLSSFNLVLNVGNSSRKAIIAWAALSYLMGQATSSGTVIVSLLLFVSPILIALIYFSSIASLLKVGKQRIDLITEAYEIELKLRVYLEEFERSSDEVKQFIHEKIELLFTYATVHFKKVPLIALWEAMYYFYYRKNLTLAIFKLSKAEIATKSLESQFFVSKFLDKLLKLEKSFERQYLHYLKLLNQAKTLDENCCQLLVSLCTELISKKIDAEKFEHFVVMLTSEMLKTTAKYYKILAAFSDNAEVLQLQGSFLNDISKEKGGKVLMERAKMLKSTELWKASGLTINFELFSSDKGVLVLIWNADTPGLIVIANPKSYEVLKRTKMDVLNKSIAMFLPKEFRDILEATFYDVFVFGTSLDTISTMFKAILNAEGFIVPMAINVQITTLDNVPHILLTLVPQSLTELLLVNLQWVITAHSDLKDIFPSDMSISYAGCPLDQLFPSLSEQLQAHDDHCVHFLPNGTELRITAEHLEFREVSLTLITVKHSVNPSEIVFGEERSLQSLSPEEKKEVRFESFEDAKPALLRELLPATLLLQPTTISLDTGIKIKKITESAMSMTSSTVFETYEVAEARNITAALLRTKALLLVSFLLLIAGVVVSVIFVTSILNSLKSITIIRDYSVRNLQIMQLAYNTRSLMLSENSQFPYNQSELQLQIQSEVVELNIVIEQMKQRVGSGNAKIDSFMLTPKVPIWRRLGSTFQFTEMTLLNALYEMTASASRLAQMSSHYSNTSEAFFLYRNGAGDLLEVANLTLDLQVKGEQVQRLQNLDIVDYLVMMCGFLIVTPLLFLVGPHLYSFEIRSKNVWEKIYGIARESILDVQMLATERLSSYFNNEVAIDSVIPKIKEKQVKPVKQWPRFVLRLAVYVICNAAYFISVEVAYFIPIKDLALTIPNYIFWAGMRPKLILEELFWMRESLLGDTPFSYFEEVPESSLWYSPDARIVTTTDSLTFLNKVLNFGDPSLGVTTVQKSAQYLDYLLQSACSDLPLPNCGDREASLGEIFFLKSWLSTLQSLRNSNITFQEFLQFEAATVDVIGAVTLSMQFYETDSINEISNTSLQIIVVSVTFMCVVVSLFLCLYSPAISFSIVKMKRALKIHKLLNTASL